MIPPSLAYLRINGFGIWLPLFLLWPIALLAAPILLIVSLFTRKPLGFLTGSYALACALRGTLIDVEQPDNIVKIRII